MMGALFICYRRSDSDIVGRIHDHLTDKLPSSQLFRDVDSIPPGDDFRAAIESYIRKSDVILVVI
jgi:hypothetical protein